MFPNPEAAEERADDKGELSASLAWFRQFEAHHGRKLRVLHIGNVANNAYVAAKMLRRAGVEADVLSYDYYHVMACPEWEEIDVRDGHVDDYAPIFSARDLGSYQRPGWFIQGPMPICAMYGIARAKGWTRCADALWPLLARARGTGVDAQRAMKRAETLFRNAQIAAIPRFKARIHARLRETFGKTGVSARRVSRDVLFYSARSLWRIFLQFLKILGLAGTAERLRDRMREFARAHNVFQPLQDAALSMASPSQASNAETPTDRFLQRAQALVQDFAEAFPDRQDRLSIDDLLPYRPHVEIFEPLFAHYDIIQAYSTDPVLPLITGKRPYVGFEHGTLRDFIRDDNFIHRLTALAYRRADHVFVTNGDCLEHARWLGVERFSPMIHPVDVDQHAAYDSVEIERLREECRGDVLLLCPIRHDWSVKGTDVHLRALPLIRDRVPGRVRLLLCPWGAQVDDSRRLLEELGCTDSVIWLPLLSRVALIRYLHAADVVLDQMALPHFGATAPQTLAAGTPLVMSYDPESTEWIVDEPAPILAAFTPEQVADAVVRALDPEWRADFKKRAEKWVRFQHHPDRLVQEHLRVYRDLMENARD
jgi:glycosyltransferase involved in cell wall biosynthesis